MSSPAMGAQRTGGCIVLDSLKLRGVTHVFGNPGTSEIPFLEELAAHPEIRYVLGLMEAAVVTMADGYAHQSGGIGVVNLHIAPGLGNAIGALYNAKEKQTPLLITAGQTDTRMRLREPMTSGDLVAMAAPVTKWSAQAETVEEVPLLVDRAVKTALEPPSGPVFVALPTNVLDAPSDAEAWPPSSLHQRGRPLDQAAEVACRLLLGSRRPVIVAGDRVARSGALEALVRVAEELGAEVHAETLPAHMPFPTGHPLFRDRLPQDQTAIAGVLADADVVLLVGGEFFEEAWYAAGSPFAEGASIVHIDEEPSRVGRNYRVDCGIVGDLQGTLALLADALNASAPAAFRAEARERWRAAERRRAAEIAALEALVRAPVPDGPIPTARAVAEVARALPAEVMVTSEIFKHTSTLLKAFPFRRRGDFLSARGGGIGQAIPTAIGMKLACPDRPCLAMSGDGSALYTVQALWTAAHERLSLVCVVLANRSYQILKDGVRRYRLETQRSVQGSYPHLEFASPPVDFVALAEGFGARGRRITRPDAITTAVADAFASGGAWVLEIVVEDK